MATLEEANVIVLGVPEKDGRSGFQLCQSIPEVAAADGACMQHPVSDVPGRTRQISSQRKCHSSAGAKASNMPDINRAAGMKIRSPTQLYLACCIYVPKGHA